MSTTAVRRLKERGGAGGKITASMPNKILTPISEKPSFGSGRKSTSNENPNPRSISRVSGPAQKPAIRPMPRMSSGDVEPRSRSRGRSPSPSDFTRILSDLRKTRVSNGDSLNRSELSNGVKGLSGFRVVEKKGFRELNSKVSEKSSNGIRVSTDGKEHANSGNKTGKLCEKVGGESKIAGTKEDNLYVKSVKSNVDDVDKHKDRSFVSQCHKDGSFIVPGNDVAQQGENGNQNVVLKPYGGLSIEKTGSDSSVKLSCGRSNTNSRVFDVSKVKEANGEGTSGRLGNKNPSKLHEKLAYLEGKVKRIASDIKKTKEMLDMNNTDESKIILSDIQEKISGIEKAMSHVIADSGTHVTVDCNKNLGNPQDTQIDSMQRTTHVTNQNEQGDCGEVSAKGLSCEELEARLFPHHKLLRNRTSLKVLASGCQPDGTQVSESSNVSNSAGSSLSPIDDNPIALEFLASLNMMQHEVRSTDGEVALNANEVQETEDNETSAVRQSSDFLSMKHHNELDLQANESLDEFDDQENKSAMVVEEEMEDSSLLQLIEIKRKTSTGGWFVSEGESVLLAHDDGSCSFYDIVNNEEKAEYWPPAGVSQNMWRDCWIIRAPGADGCSGKYVVAASAGNTLDSGFCSWDFYSKDVRAFHIEDNTNTRLPLGPLPDNIMHRRNALSAIMASDNQQWWYGPCGPLVVSAASCQRAVKVFDIRDGEQIMNWVVQKPILGMDYSSPLQWRNRGKVVVAETEAISLWDVSSLNPQASMSVSTSGRRISALHVNNTDAELGGGVRQRVSSSEAEGNDGVFCTADSINILDFRQPSGIGLKIPKIGVCVQSISSRGDSIFLGCSTVSSAAKKQVSSQVLQLSLRRQKIVHTYTLPESNAHPHHKALTQVWGNSNLVMAVCGLGLFVFDALKDDGLPSFAIDYSSHQKVREIIGPDDLYSPSFDHLSSQLLLISRDRPAMWRCLS